jgi:uncharacterized protein (DUF983 family)
MIFRRDIPPDLRDRFEGRSFRSPFHQHRTFKEILGILKYGFRKICPNCKQASMFRTYFKMHDYCPNCGIKYEREPGEYIVAMYINIITTEILFITGYLLTDYFFNWPMWTEIAIWVGFNGLFPTWFYPRTRGIWAAVLYLGGGLYKD